MGTRPPHRLLARLPSPEIVGSASSWCHPQRAMGAAAAGRQRHSQGAYPDTGRAYHWPLGPPSKLPPLSPQVTGKPSSISRARARSRGTELLNSLVSASDIPVSAGELLSEGTGRPAPVLAEVGPFAFAFRVGRSRPVASGPRGRSILASRSAATCDTGSGAGGRASAFRTALGMCPRPVVCQSPNWRHGLNPPPTRRPHLLPGPKIICLGATD
jgi:hypothetical protein